MQRKLPQKLLPPKEIASHIYHSWGSSEELGHTDFDAFGHSEEQRRVRADYAIQWQSLCPVEVGCSVLLARRRAASAHRHSLNMVLADSEHLSLLGMGKERGATHTAQVHVLRG